MTRWFLSFPMNADERIKERSSAHAILADLAEAIADDGLIVRQGVEPWDDYGWSLVVREGEADIWIMIQASDEWLIQSWPQLGLSDRLRGRDHSTAHETVCRAVHRSLAGQRNLSGRTWLTEQQFHAT